MNAFYERHWAINLTAAAALLSTLQAGGFASLKAEQSEKDERKALRKVASTQHASVGGNKVSGNAAIVGVMSIMGVVTRYGDGCGGAGTEHYIAMIEKINADDDYCAGVIRFEFPGGYVNGCEALAKAIRESKKPIVAWIAGTCYSAAYWLASQCREIWIESKISTELGSIGVYSMHEDWTEALKLQGKKITIIRAEGCDEKILLNPFEPAPDGAMEAERDVTTSIYKLFKADVKAVRPQLADEAMKGLTYQGGEGLKNGLADKVGTLRDAINRAAQLARA